ncbi:MAG TPA: hypothetical protein VD835_01960 [Pyrinomonadaceae bacterium]|nr:hypothetical protein [Pyrinomonadaceae bacterium]
MRGSTGLRRWWKETSAAATVIPDQAQAGRDNASGAAVVAITAHAHAGRQGRIAPQLKHDDAVGDLLRKANLKSF